MQGASKTRPLCMGRVSPTSSSLSPAPTKGHSSCEGLMYANLQIRRVDELALSRSKVCHRKLTNGKQPLAVQKSLIRCAGKTSAYGGRSNRILVLFWGNRNLEPSRGRFKVRTKLSASRDNATFCRHGSIDLPRLCIFRFPSRPRMPVHPSQSIKPSQRGIAVKGKKKVAFILHTSAALLLLQNDVHAVSRLEARECHFESFVPGTPVRDWKRLKVTGPGTEMRRS